MNYQKNSIGSGKKEFDKKSFSKLHIYVDPAFNR